MRRPIPVRLPSSSVPSVGKSSAARGRRAGGRLAGGLAAGLLAIAAASSPALADYVGSDTNRIYLDPDAIGDLLDGYDTGDELAYIMETTPRDTGSINGHAAWQTFFVPPGVEVIGAEFVKASGASFVTIPAEDTDTTNNGWGQRGSKSYAPTSGVTQLANGFVNEVQQDSGIFYSTDPRTQTETTQILPAITPTGPQTKPAVIYNQWDYDQVLAFGTSTALSGNKGQGNTPMLSTDSGSTWTGTGSPVAGPNSRYTNDYNPACNGGATCTGTTAQCDFAADVQCAGPWQRIVYANSKIGGSTTITPALVAGSLTYTGVPTATGVTVSGASPLPASTNAIRWVHGKRTLGDIELSRVRLRITDAAAFLASFTDNTFCLESTGGDTSGNGVTLSGAKDNNWRYYEPVHKCYAALGGPPSDAILLKQFTHVQGAPGSGSFLNTNNIVGWQVTFTNTGSETLTNVTLTDTPDTANLTLVEPGAQALCPYASYDGDIPGPAYVGGSATLGTAQWLPVPSLAPGASFSVFLCGKVGTVSAGDVVSNTADVTYTHPDTTIDTLSSTASGTGGSGRLAGMVRLDTDNDGNPADADQGIPSVTIELWNDANNNGVVDGGDTLRATTTTQPDGSYEFLNVPAGNYVVRETNPAGLTSTFDKDTANICGSGNFCDQIDVTMTSTSSNLGNDFLDYGECLADGDCDNGQFCDGTETCSAFFCVAGSDPCAGGDVCGNVCNESADNCFVTAGTECRASIGACDVAETCTGSSASCPADSVAPASTPCGSSSDTVCDNPDTCDGSGNCSANPEPVTTECRAPGGICDAGENCDGAGACPADVFTPGGTECRAAAGDCDVAETCTGSSASCPADSFAAASTPCGSSSDTVCDNPDTCDGGGNCDANPEPATTECRADGGACDVAENCDGAGACPADIFEPASTPCGDPSDTACDNPDTCDASGTCQANADPGSPSCTSADVAIAKVDLTGQVQAGAFTTYQVTVTNNGPSNAANVVVTDTIDPNTQYAASSLPCVEAPAGTLTCSLGTINAGDSRSFTVVVYVETTAPTASSLTGPSCPGGEDVCNRVTVTSSTPDSDPGNNDAEVATDVIVATTFSELSMVKSDVTPEPVTPGSNVTYEVRVTNNGPDTATDVMVYDSLDPFMTYVSDNVGCTVTSVGSPLGAQLACPLGDITSGSSATLSVVVTIALNAPIGSSLEDGDCDATEDICNAAVVGTSSSDSTFPNNRDNEPTDVSPAVLCGNGSLDAGEQCDPPSGEICNNTIDDDGDMAVDCADTDCSAPGFESCDANCQRVAACVPILDDPARITKTFVKMHGKYIPLTPVDPEGEGFVFLLTNEDGEIYRGRLLPGDMVMTGDPGPGLKRWQYKDQTAKGGGGVRAGIFRIEVKERVEKDGSLSYPFRIRVYGDFSGAVRPKMTSQVYLGGDVGHLTAEWTGKPGNWSLSKKHADAGRP